MLKPDGILNEESNNKLQMYGGILGGLVPLIVMISLLIWLSVADRGGTKAFWAAGWLALVVGLFLARNKSDYCNSIMRGIGDKNGIVIITAWLFAGVFGELMVGGGLIQGLLWFGLKTGAQGTAFTVITFVTACIFSLGTGTSTGTVLALVPVMYPAGVFLGANPVMLAAGILSGAAWGDAMAPVSDTTIVSAYTQGATMNDVVRNRLPLALSAAVISIVVLLLTGGGGKVSSLPKMAAQLDPGGLLMLVAFAVVVISALSGRHIVESLIYGDVSAVILGLVNGHLKLTDIFCIPAVKGDPNGLIQNGIEGLVGPIVFALLILGVTQVLIESGVMDKILQFCQKTIAKSVRQAELAIIYLTVLISIPISANAPAELVVGPSLVKPLGEKFNLAPARRANLMDCAVSSVFYMLPWHICVIVWFTAVASAAKSFHIVAPPITAAFLNPFSWAILAIITISAITGWNRKYALTENNEK